MNFDEFDRDMRRYENSIDQKLLPGLYAAARLDGRSFTRLTKEICGFEAPFDVKFRDFMTYTAKHLMNCGFRIVYAYTESDEISLLFHRNDDSFRHRVQKMATLLAGEASAVFSLKLGIPAAFDCRIIPLPNRKLVADYFRWRQEDSRRNSLNAHCYWQLRKDGLSQSQATEMLSGKSIAFKNELLFEKGINYNDLPAWQKRGIGLYYRNTEKEGFDPVKNVRTTAVRREIYTDYELPLGDDYAKLVLDKLDEQI